MKKYIAPMLSCIKQGIIYVQALYNIRGMKMTNLLHKTKEGVLDRVKFITENRTRHYVDKYGVGWAIQLMDDIIALSVHTAYEDGINEGMEYASTEELIESYYMNGYDAIFELNGIEHIKPKPALFNIIVEEVAIALTEDEN